MPNYVQNFAKYKRNPQRIAKDFYNCAKGRGDICQIWSH